MTENQSSSSENISEELDLDALNQAAISAGSKGADIRRVGKLMKELDDSLREISGGEESKIKQYSSRLRGYLADSVARCM